MNAPRQIRLTLLPPHPCPYLPGREARSEGFLAQRMSPEVYLGLMDVGFRRSGALVYRPKCVGCTACRPLRVGVETFVATRSQRRVWRRNLDLSVRVGEARATEEKFAMYATYVREWHAKEEEANVRSFVEFLYSSPVLTLEMEYRDRAGKLVGVGICDRSEKSLSSVYFYFDPAQARRGLGNFAAMWEIEFARREKIPWYYLGYWVNDCSAMEYKARFGPHQILGEDGLWR
jgi:arginine-tRNA-protein transferase